MPDITLIFPRSEFLLNEAVFPPLGMLYVAGILECAGIDVQCLDLGLGNTLDDIEADVVGISFTTAHLREVHAITVELKYSRNKYLIGGGPHVTHVPFDKVSSQFDVIMQGKFDYYYLRYLCDILGKKLEMTNEYDLDYIWPKRDSLPMRDYEYTIDMHPTTVLMSSYGCPYNCAFCSVSKEYSIRNGYDVVAEIKHINKAYGFTGFMLFDDVFTQDLDRLHYIADELEDNPFVYRCFARANTINDEVCKELVRLDVREVGLGIETGSDKLLKLCRKGTTVKMNTHAVQLLKKYGIRTKAFIIVGLPGETYQTIDETDRWLRENQPDDVDVSVLQALPGSAFFKDPGKFGITIKEDDGGWYKGTPGLYNTNVRLDTLSVRDVITARAMLEEKYKRPELLK